MNRKQVMEIILDKLDNCYIVSANGFISRDLFNIIDKKTNFYMIGSMGLASSIGLGIALKNPKKKILIFDGDGNILMNLGSLVTVGKLQPKNFVHIIFDNSIHESTGGQPTGSETIDIDKIAKKCNYKHVYKISTKNNIIKTIKKIKKYSGPIMILIKISKGESIGKRISREPIEIKKDFMRNFE